MICPIEWRGIAEIRSPSPCFMTDWIDGRQAPIRIGWYERHFTGSPWIGLASMQYWDGIHWRTKEGQMHWHQVGDYPAWRGITKEQAKLYMAAGIYPQENT